MITDPIGIDISLLKQYLDYSYIISPPSSIPSNLFIIDTIYEISVTLCNFLGSCGNAIAFVSIESTQSIPIVTIFGNKEKINKS